MAHSPAGERTERNRRIETALSAEENLLQFGEKWRRQYPSCVKSREKNWEVLSTFFEYPPEVRGIIYTTNIIEGLNRQFCQITKNKPSFTNDDSLRRMLYLVSHFVYTDFYAMSKPQSLRNLSSQPKRRSTTQRRDKTTNLCHSLRYTSSTCAPQMSFT